MEGELRALDEQLRAAATSLTWRDDCRGYLERVGAAAAELGRRVQRAQGNVRAMQRAVGAWAERTLLPRGAPRREPACAWGDKGDLFAKKYKLIRDDGCRIHSLVEVTASEGTAFIDPLTSFRKRAEAFHLMTQNLGAACKSFVCCVVKHLKWRNLRYSPVISVDLTVLTPERRAWNVRYSMKQKGERRGLRLCQSSSLFWVLLTATII